MPHKVQGYTEITYKQVRQGYICNAVGYQYCLACCDVQVGNLSRKRGSGPADLTQIEAALHTVQAGLASSLQWTQKPADS